MRTLSLFVEDTMRGMIAPLSLNEETTLRRVGFGTEGDLDPRHVRRLLQLELIEWNGWTWRLTSLGRRRYDSVVFDQGYCARPAA